MSVYNIIIINYLLSDHICYTNNKQTNKNLVCKLYSHTFLSGKRKPFLITDNTS